MKKAILLSALISLAVIPAASAKTVIRERVINSPDYIITPAPTYVVRPERPAYVDGYYQKVPPHHRHYHRRHGYDWGYWDRGRR